MKNKEEKIEFQKKVHRRIFVRDITLLAACPSCYVIFCCFFRLLRFYEEKKILLQKMVGGLAPSDPTLPPSSPSVHGPATCNYQLRNILKACLKMYGKSYKHLMINI